MEKEFYVHDDKLQSIRRYYIKQCIKHLNIELEKNKSDEKVEKFVKNWKDYLEYQLKRKR